MEIYRYQLGDANDYNRRGLLGGVCIMKKFRWLEFKNKALFILAIVSMNIAFASLLITLLCAPKEWWGIGLIILEIIVFVVSIAFIWEFLDTYDEW